MKGGAAEKAGIKNGDVITKINHVEVNSASELQELVARQRPGDKINVEVIRAGKSMTYAVKLSNKKGTMEILKEEKNKVLEMLGADFEELSASEKRKLGVKLGLRVAKLSRGKLSMETGMREGFIILSVDGRPVSTTEDLISILSTKKGGVMIAGVYPGDPRVFYYAFGL